MEIVTETESLAHLKNLGKLIGPYIIPTLGLIVYTFKKLEKTQDKLEETITEHIKADDHVHDKLFTESRKQGETISTLKANVKSLQDADGTHNQMFKSVAIELDECRESVSEFKIECAKKHGGK